MFYSQLNSPQYFPSFRGVPAGWGVKKNKKDNLEFCETNTIKIFRISKLRVLHDLDNVMREFENYIVEEYKA